MASSPQHEPTMEEILASIRKIISEDAPEGAPAPEPEPIAAPEEHEVLELTQELPPEPKPEPVVAAVPPPKPEPDVVFQEVAIEEPPVPDAPASDDIFSDSTRKAMDETFAKIPEAVATAPAPLAAAPSHSFTTPEGLSVEAVFERAITSSFDPMLQKWMDTNKSELMASVKPLIREWMDEHFPALLEGAVRNEVERVVKARGHK
jgi:cell pole-organizing protein PopZ